MDTPSRVGELGRGMLDALRGAAYLARNPRLWVWVIAPAAVAAVILLVVVGWLLAVLGGPIAALGLFLPGAWTDNVLRLASKVAFGVAGVSIFVSLASLVAGPFNEMLSEAIEERLTGVASPRFRVGRFLVDVAIGAAHAARRISVYAVMMGVLVVIGFAVPVIGTGVAAVGGAIVTARYASYDAYDSIWSRRRWRYRDKTAFLRAHRWRTLGLGAVVAVMFVIPGLNVLGLSIGATAATLRWEGEGPVSGRQS